jgi:hypothetical protein
MLTLRMDIDEAEFKQHLVATLTRGGVKLHHAVRTAILAGISRRLDKLVAAGTCLRYGFKNGNQSRVVSLQEAVEHNGFDFWYLDLQIDLFPGIMLTEREAMPPSVMQWLPIDYGSGIQKTFKFKHIAMKTRERYEIQLLHPQVPAKVLRAVLQQFEKSCSCNSRHLVPFPNGVWEWQQSFGCVLCGTRYFCECFRTAINKSQKSESPQNGDDARIDAGAGYGNLGETRVLGPGRPVSEFVPANHDRDQAGDLGNRSGEEVLKSGESRVEGSPAGLGERDRGDDDNQGHKSYGFTYPMRS